MEEPNSEMALLPLLLSLIPILLLLKTIKKLKTSSNHLPPGPPQLPLIGNLHQIGTLVHQSYRDLSNKYGPIMFLKFGRAPVVVISSAEAAKQVLKIHDLDTCSRPQLTAVSKLTYNNLDIAFGPYGDYWRRIRKMCVLEVFSLKRVQSFQLIREEEVGLMMDSISQASRSNSPIDLSEKITTLTGSIVTRIAFGKRLEGTKLNNDKFSELVREANALLGRFSADDYLPYKIGWIFDKLSGFHAKLDRVFRTLDDFFEDVIREHLKPDREPVGNEDIVDVMLELLRKQTSSGENWLKKDHMKAIIFVSCTKSVIWCTLVLISNVLFCIRIYFWQEWTQVQLL